MSTPPASAPAPAVPGAATAEASIVEALFENPYGLLAFSSTVIIFAIKFTTTLLNYGTLSDPPPAECEGIFDDKRRQKAAEYSGAKTRTGLFFDVCDELFDMAFWLTGSYALLDVATTKHIALAGSLPEWADASIVHGILYILLYTYIGWLRGIPQSLYNNFVVEERFGFNRMTWATWVKDQIKAVLLQFVLVSLVAGIALKVWSSAGDQVVLYVWLTMAAVQLLLLFVAPILILPLFLKLTPLPGGKALVVSGVPEGLHNPLLKRVLFWEGCDDDAHCESYGTKDERFGKGKPYAKLTLRRVAAGGWELAENGESVLAQVGGGSGSVPPAKGWRWTPDGQKAVKKAEEETAAKKVDAAAESASLLEGADVDPASVSDDLVFTEVDMGNIRERITAMAAKHSFKFKDLFVVDASRRSSHSNAFMMGFGSTRRIALFDVLFHQMTADEICAVLGHEMGHAVLNHVTRMIVWALVQQALMLWIMSQVVTNAQFQAAFFVPSPKLYIGFVLFGQIYQLVDWLTSRVDTLMSRKHEYEADTFAIDGFPGEGHGRHLISALKALAKENFSHLAPHPAHVWLTYSHPPMHMRIREIRTNLSGS